MTGGDNDRGEMQKIVHIAANKAIRLNKLITQNIRLTKTVNYHRFSETNHR